MPTLQTGILTLDQLAKLLAVDTLEKFEERIWEFDPPSDWTEEDIQTHLGEQTKKYRNALESVAEDLFAKHHLDLVELKTKSAHFRVCSSNWVDSCSKLIQTINGVGLFYFNNPRELKEVGPYTTYRQAALHHLHWMTNYAEVYGTSKPAIQIEQLMR